MLPGRPHLPHLTANGAMLRGAARCDHLRPFGVPSGCVRGASSTRVQSVADYRCLHLSLADSERVARLLFLGLITRPGRGDNGWRGGAGEQVRSTCACSKGSSTVGPLTKSYLP